MSTRVTRLSSRANQEQSVLTDQTNVRASSRNAAQNRKTAQSRLREGLNAANETYNSTLNRVTQPSK